MGPHYSSRERIEYPGAGSESSSFVGSIDYMSPEARDGRIADTRSDIYAIGVIGYTLLTGQKPMGMAKPPSTLIKGLDRRWDGLLGRCLEVDPEKRWYKSAEAVLAALKALTGAGSKKRLWSGLTR